MFFSMIFFHLWILLVFKFFLFFIYGKKRGFRIILKRFRLFGNFGVIFRFFLVYNFSFVGSPGFLVFFNVFYLWEKKGFSSGFSVPRRHGFGVLAVSDCESVHELGVGWTYFFSPMCF